MNLLHSIRDVWNRMFDSEPKRRPRRKRCSCGHTWRLHRGDGCSFKGEGGMCLCSLNRQGVAGKPARRAPEPLKESA